MAVCKCCGQTLPEPFPPGLNLRAGQAVIFKAVLAAGKHGLSSERLVLLRYGNDPTGGPIDSHNALAVHIGHINKKLAPFGKQIKGDRGGAGNFYRLVSLKEK